MQNDLKSEKVISDRYKFIWIGIPKAATRSILTALYRQPDVELGSREVTDELWRLLGENGRYSDYFKFTFVRNPWARVVSCWKNKIHEPKEDVIIKIINKYPGLRPNMPFDEFVRFLSESPFGRDEGANRHWASQFLFITDPSGRVLVNVIGKTENIANDFEAIRQQIGLPQLELPWLNTHLGWDPGKETLVNEDSRYYRDFYNAEIRELVRRRYRIDIEAFGYEF